MEVTLATVWVPVLVSVLDVLVRDIVRLGKLCAADSRVSTFPVQLLLHAPGRSRARLMGLDRSMLLPALRRATAANDSNREMVDGSMLAGRLGTDTDMGLVGEARVGASVLLAFTWFVCSTVLPLLTAENGK